MLNPLKKILKKPFDYLFYKRLRQFHYYPTTHIEPQDIVIAGYPKSGNTWMQNLAAGAIYGIDTQFLPDKLTQELVPDIHIKNFYKRILDFSVFKSHSLPQPNYKRVVHLVRDGRDAMVSYYAMNKSQGLSYTLEEMVKEGKGLTPSKWHEHSQQWLDNPYQAEILTIRYEDLLEKPLDVLQQFCAFANIERSAETLESVIMGNSFQKMQQKEHKFGWNNTNWKKEASFIRKGKMGAYKTEMPSALIHSFEQEAQDMLHHFNYSLYDSIPVN